MMQRKKHDSGNGGADYLTASDGDDDGGSAKQKPSHLVFAPRLRAAFSPSASSASSKQLKGRSSPSYCLPGVPVVFKLVLLSFVGFAMLVVLTAKGRHEHWRYKNGIRVPHMPVPLLDRLKRTVERSKQGGRTQFDENSDKSESSSDATKRMLAQPSRFVDSEKKLKRQLLKLLDKQNEDKKHKPDVPQKSILGVKISTRYLGEDLLPYPASKGVEEEWEKKMNKRKAELTKTDEKEWGDMMQQYNEAMEIYVEANEHADHALDIHAGQKNVQQRVDNAIEGGKSPGVNNAVRPPKVSEQWPSPAEKAGADTTILLKPAFGSHRPSQNSILVFAEGYDLSIYLAFVESLINTGYDGDVVFSISSEEKLKPGVKEYLQSKNSDTSGVNIVAYEVNWSCFKQSGEAAAGSAEGVNHCKMNNAFGDATGNPISDPRDPRPVATARYELYWMWSLQYSKESWLMLIDARDVWFQLDPYRELSSRGKVSGELHFFGENADAAKIGTSRFNRKWLVQAYGEKEVSPFFEEPIICSGSTIGNQDAIETYLRAMVAEYDATLCKSKGCDQGFHNYLYYSGKLGTKGNASGVEGISNVIVHEQGKGIINNVAALRDKSLSELGLYDAKRELVLNWDGTTSAVAHQYDRDKEANIMVKGKKRQFSKKWKEAFKN